MPKISDSLSHKNVVCPFCSLHCDDLEINVYDNKLSVENNVPKSCAFKFEQLIKNLITDRGCIFFVGKAS